MSYKEQIFKELEKVKDGGGTIGFSEYKPNIVKQYTFQFNQLHKSDLMCCVLDGVAFVSRRQDSQSIQDYVELEMGKLKNIGDYCVLEGNISTLRSCVCRYSKALNLDVMTKRVGDKLRVVVMGVK
jgi:hypothetical protein